ncbi:MAG: ATP-grasp domain-containing protein [Desulfobacterales bacterium]
MRFAFPGKLGQIRLFRKVGIHHPHTLCFEDLNSFCLQFSGPEKTLPFSFPFVFKFDWGGEGDMVFLIRSQNEFSDAIKKARHFENTGQKGFLIQEYVPSGSKSLRIAVIGHHLCSYWRIQKNPTIFKTGLSCGSSIDYQSDPETIQTAESVLKNFLKTTKINLAGFDFLISKFSKKIYILEINYFFGRRGLGGSEAFYAILISEINQWLKSLGYTRNLSIDTN